MLECMLCPVSVSVHEWCGYLTDYAANDNVIGGPGISTWCPLSNPPNQAVKLTAMYNVKQNSDQISF